MNSRLNELHLYLILCDDIQITVLIHVLKSDWCGYIIYHTLGLCQADCEVSGSTVDVFGKATDVNLTVTNSPLSVATGHRYTAEYHPPSSHNVPAPQSDGR